MTGRPAAIAAAEVRDAPPTRQSSLNSIQRELTAFARRARATAARMHPDLSLVSYTILAHLEEQQGCRATDLAAHYLLDKSTVSRQVAALERLEYIERRTDPTDQRVQVLHLAPKGVEVLTAAQLNRRAAFDQRLADWEPADLERFAAYLRRYNEDAASHVAPQADAASHVAPQADAAPADRVAEPAAAGPTRRADAAPAG
jgi:DNA-binding MarR family transcriptional regulator